MAAIIPAIIAIPIQINVCEIDIENVSKPSSLSAWMRLHAKNIPKPVPKAAPNIEIIEDSIKIILLICFL